MGSHERIEVVPSSWRVRAERAEAVAETLREALEKLRDEDEAFTTTRWHVANAALIKADAEAERDLWREVAEELAQPLRKLSAYAYEHYASIPSDAGIAMVAAHDLLARFDALSKGDG